jgi:HSP20 family protein
MKLVTYQRPGLAWPSFGQLLNLNDELDRMFETSSPVWTPPLDVHEDKDKFTVTLELPGLQREDIAVQIEDDSLVISGERKSETVSEGTEVHRRERYHGKFSRALTLPVAVAPDQVKAAYKDGILTVTLPKAEAAKPKHIDVSVN